MQPEDRVNLKLECPCKNELKCQRLFDMSNKRKITSPLFEFVGKCYGIVPKRVPDVAHLWIVGTNTLDHPSGIIFYAIIENSLTSVLHFINYMRYYFAISIIDD